MVDLKSGMKDIVDFSHLYMSIVRPEKVAKFFCARKHPEPDERQFRLPDHSDYEVDPDKFRKYGAYMRAQDRRDAAFERATARMEEKADKAFERLDRRRGNCVDQLMRKYERSDRVFTATQKRMENTKKHEAFKAKRADILEKLASAKEKPKGVARDRAVRYALENLAYHIKEFKEFKESKIGTDRLFVFYSDAEMVQTLPAKYRGLYRRSYVGLIYAAAETGDKRKVTFMYKDAREMGARLPNKKKLDGIVAKAQERIAEERRQLIKAVGNGIDSFIGSIEKFATSLVPDGE